MFSAYLPDDLHYFSWIFPPIVRRHGAQRAADDSAAVCQPFREHRSKILNQAFAWVISTCQNPIDFAYSATARHSLGPMCPLQSSTSYSLTDPNDFLDFFLQLTLTVRNGKSGTWIAEIEPFT